MDLGLVSKTALVLGASRGLGAAIARLLAEEGARVIAAARSDNVIRLWADRLPAEIQARIVPLRVDLADLPGVDALAEGLLADGGVDILVNNGGGPPLGKTSDISVDQWTAQFRTMAAHQFHLTDRMLPAMIRRRWGRVITIASAAVEQPIPNLALSNTIRAGVLGWSKTLATEVAPHGITVNVVLPGHILTDRVREYDRATAEKLGQSVEESTKSLVGRIPAGRYGDPAELANVVAFLASERASYVTGSKIRVDGGVIQAP